MIRLRRKKNMDNKIEVIGIDHGWSMMKSVSEVFVTGIKEITSVPALYRDTLEYKGKYYKAGKLAGRKLRTRRQRMTALNY